MKAVVGPPSFFDERVSLSATPLISVRNLTKRYGGVVALADMNLEVERGTIHAVVGENGAGKSTLMKVLAGSVRPDSGDILIEGAAASIDSPAAARKQGIGIVYQELSLFPERSVLANLFVNREPTRRGLISLRAMEDESRAMLDRLGLRCRRARAAEAAQHRRAATGRALPRAAGRAAAADPRRAQFGAQPARDGTAVRGAAGPALARHHHALRLAPAGGSLFDQRPRHRDPQRPRRAWRGRPPSSPFPK